MERVKEKRITLNRTLGGKTMPIGKLSCSQRIGGRERRKRTKTFICCRMIIDFSEKLIKELRTDIWSADLTRPSFI